jgi:hypothetical protein
MGNFLGVAHDFEREAIFQAKEVFAANHEQGAVADLGGNGAGDGEGSGGGHALNKNRFPFSRQPLF